MTAKVTDVLKIIMLLTVFSKFEVVQPRFALSIRSIFATDRKTPDSNRKSVILLKMATKTIMIFRSACKMRVIILLQISWGHTEEERQVLNQSVLDPSPHFNIPLGHHRQKFEIN